MTLATLSVTLMLLLQAGGQVGRPGELSQPPPKLDVKLFAGQDALTPGGEMPLAVEISVPPPWHIYHPIIVDTGLPTRVRFRVPPGIEVDPLRWPSPALGDTVGIEYLEFKGTITAVTTVRAAADVEVGKAFRLEAVVDGLACIEACVPVETKASLTVAMRAESAASADAEKIAKAIENLAPALGETERLKGSSIAFEKSTLKPGDETEIVAKLNIADGWHIQHRDPGVEGLIPTRLFIEPIAGLKIADEEDWKWPTPKRRTIEYVGTVNEIGGKAEVRIPVELVDDKFKRGPVTLRALVQFQACDDSGVCEAPLLAATTVSFTAETEAEPRATGLVARDAGQWVDGEAARDAGDAADGGQAAAAGGGSGSNSGGGAVAGGGGASVSVVALLGWMLFAFIGGLILNVMPCVLPVISLKVMSFVQQGGEDPGRVFRLGLAFCAGIMVWFWIFAIVSVVFDVQPLQEPMLVLAIASVLFVMALNLFGVFEIVLPGSVASSMDEASSREGYGGSFFKGFLATLLGTACTAPFLAGALAFAIAQPFYVSFIVFSSAGVGMSAPYLLLAAQPAWLKYVPKPGGWMTTFKQSMGFVLIGTAIWLLGILGAQLGTSGAVWTVGFWSFLALSAFLIGKISPSWSPASHAATWAAAIAVSASGYWFSFEYMYEEPEAMDTSAWVRAGDGAGATPQVDVEAVLATVKEKGWEEEIPWVHYTAGIEMAQQIAAEGHTVYVDYTADWCVNCKANLYTVLETDRIRGVMEELGVVPLEADFTRKDPVMREEIISYGSNSVPVNIIVPANRPDEVIVLPTLLKQSTVEEKLREAAGARTASAAGFG